MLIFKQSLGDLKAFKRLKAMYVNPELTKQNTELYQLSL